MSCLALFGSLKGVLPGGHQWVRGWIYLISLPRKETLGKRGEEEGAVNHGGILT